MSATTNAHGTHISGQRSIILDSRFNVKPVTINGKTSTQEFEPGDFRFSYLWTPQEVQLSVTYFDGSTWLPVNTDMHRRIEAALKDQGYYHHVVVPPHDQPVLIPLTKQAA